MARLALAVGMLLLLALEWRLSLGAPSAAAAEQLGRDAGGEEQLMEYALKRSLESVVAAAAGRARGSPAASNNIGGGDGVAGLEELLMEARGRRATGSGGGMGSSFIRFGRAGKAAAAAAALEPVSQPHTRSDIIIRYGRDELKNRLALLRQERMQRLARLALVCAKSQEDVAPNSAEERIIREMCRDAPLHPTVPDFV